MRPKFHNHCICWNITLVFPIVFKMQNGYERSKISGNNDKHVYHIIIIESCWFQNRISFLLSLLIVLSEQFSRNQIIIYYDIDLWTLSYLFPFKCCISKSWWYWCLIISRFFPFKCCIKKSWYRYLNFSLLLSFQVLHQQIYLG